LGEVLQQVLNEVPARTTLEAFAPALAGETTDPVIRQVAALIRDVLRGTAFVPTIAGIEVLPQEALLWKHDLGQVLDPTRLADKARRLVVPDLVERCSSELSNLGADTISDETAVEFLVGCRNDSEQSTLESLRCLMRYLGDTTPEELSGAVPCWWSINGVARPLEGTGLAALFRGQEGRAPNWLRTDVLKDSFLAAANAVAAAETLRRSNVTDLMARVIPWTPENVVHRAIVPSLEGRGAPWWDQNGWSVLRYYKKWSRDLKYGDAYELESNDLRRRLSRVLRVPTTRGWMAACDVYAGRSWGGPRAFDRYVAKLEDRGLLLPRRSWKRLTPKDDAWKSSLTYAGVAWEPKLRNLVRNAGTAVELWSDQPSQDVGTLSGWREYRTEVLAPGISGKGNVRIRELWCIEHWPGCLADQRDPARHVRALASTTYKLCP
jgi:hypothetical protein